ncbi:hypothetical protein [Aquitalea aquatica]|uniref:Uncharacterized protein n=1 Tax=Aquitalea aquatica TaxID=3044273 RepID=A0A838Y6R6_9NEIS|nr:hypothetical protein [Aquitalea magnusonii]MBA4710386.1 hypothetical protein [Aquitalea magnusonii]
MKAYLLTVVERDGRRYTVCALASSCGEACLNVLDMLGRVAGITGRRIK